MTTSVRFMIHYLVLDLEIKDCIIVQVLLQLKLEEARTTGKYLENVCWCSKFNIRSKRSLSKFLLKMLRICVTPNS